MYTGEIDRFARQTYEANFAVEAEDIRDVDPRDIPPYDLLAAGFPCQPFSIAGVSKNLSLGREHGFDDAKSGNLFFEIERLIREADRRRSCSSRTCRNLRSHDGGNHRRDPVGGSRTSDTRSTTDHRRPAGCLSTGSGPSSSGSIGTPSMASDSSSPTCRSLRVQIFQRASDGLDPKYVLSQHLWDYLQEYKAKHRAAGNGFGYGLVRSG